MVEKIILKEEKETLLIPLYGKAMESKKKNPLIRDIKGMEIIERIAYPFEKLHIPEKTNMMMSMRAAMLDRYAEAFIQQHPNSMCLHLGCGLDDEKELTACIPNLVFQEERYFLDPIDLDKLSSGMRFMFLLSGHFRMARKAHRIMIFEVK